MTEAAMGAVVGPAVLAEVERRRMVIADVDAMIVSLLNRRQAESIALQMYKRDNGMPQKDKDQERRVVDRIRRLNGGPMTCEMLESVYAVVFRHACAEEGG